MEKLWWSLSGILSFTVKNDYRLSLIQQRCLF